jgi:hypothetical protein
MRAFNRILCTLLAVAIAIAGVLTVIEVIAAATDNDPVVIKWHGFVNDLASNEWKTAAPRVTAIILIIVGLLLLLFALRRGKPATVALTTGASDVDMTTTRRSLTRSLANNAESVDGIASAKVKVKRRKVVVKASGLSGVSREDATSRLTSAMQERLDGLALADARRLKVRVTPAPDKKTPSAPSGLSDSTGSGQEASDDADRAPVGAGSTRGGAE